MPAWPKSLLSFGASVLTARMAGKLRRDIAQGPAQQARVFSQRVSSLARTRFWTEAGIKAGMSYDAFRRSVKLRSYDAFSPAIERMLRGERDVLAPGACSFFATSSGTGSAQSKTIPVTAEMLAHFRQAFRDALLFYTARTRHAAIFHGRHLFLTGSTALRASREAAHASFVGDWPAIAALNVPAWMERHFYEPGPRVADLADWQAKVDAVIARTAHADITLLGGMAPWILAFVDAMRGKLAEQGRKAETLQDIWPNLEVVVHGGVMLNLYQPELRAAVGPGVAFHEVYAAAEGVFAAQDTSASELRVLTNAGIFFEFVPLVDWDPTRLESMGEKALPLAETQVNIDYVVLITTPAGFARYVYGDIVRFTSLAPHRLVYAGRIGLSLSAFGETVLEREVTDALLAVCQRHRWHTVNFHVAPLFGPALTGASRGRHEWWVELRPGTVETPTGPQMALELDAELQRLNRSYAEKRAQGRIESPTVRLVMPGVFRHWLRFHGKWNGNAQVARCRSDRIIANELAQITRFAHD